MTDDDKEAFRRAMEEHAAGGERPTESETPVRRELQRRPPISRRDEGEAHHDPLVTEISDDLNYLKAWFAWHPSWAHMEGRPVIFVYNEVGCEVADRWMAASNSEWYVVLKLFKGFRDCTVQPDSWHQYGPADAVVRIENHSFGVSPGFWRADIAQPLLDRVSQTDFCNNVNMMVQSNDPWQLVTTFNEAGEGTMVEPSPHWASASGYGFYLDCLHTYH